jgi:hypothetical protein
MTINIYGRVGSVSETAIIGTLNMGSGPDQDISITDLANDIAKILEFAKSLPDASANPEDIAALEKAKENADKGDFEGAVAKLKKVAGWVLTGLRDIGTNIAAAIIVKTLGLP